MARLGIFLSAALMMACTNTVVGPDEGDGGGGQGGAGAGGSGQGNDGASDPHYGGAGGCGIDCPPSNAIVYESGGIEPGTGGGSSTQTVTTTTGGGPPADMVHLQISDYGESCGLADELLPCGGFTRYTLTLPKSLLAPGIVYLSHPDVWLSIEETTPGTGEDCGYGFGGGFEDGQLEIFSVSGETLTGALVGITTFGSYDPNGQVVASLCGL